MKKELVYSFVGMFAAAILLLSMLAPPASAQVRVGDIQSAIKAAGAPWVAAENPITKLTPGEQKQLLGVKEGPKTTSNPPTTVASVYGLPPSLDWRNNGGNYVTSVKNQEYCGSCWAFSAVAALESATLIANNTPNTDLNLSEQVLVSCCYTTCSPNGNCRGGYPEKAADFLRDTGVPLLSCYPYMGDGLCSSACPNWQASAYKAKSWRYVVNNSQGETPTVDKIRAGLQNGPLATTMAVYDDFFFYSFGVYKYARGILEGYHAILVVGYDDVGQYFIAKNSWGTSWGEQGFFKIAYSEVTGQSQFGYETIAYYVGGDSPNPTCTYTLNPTSQTVTAAAGTGSVDVTAVSGCAWTAKSNASWITVTGANSGSGTAKIYYAVAANSGATRTGTMTIGGQTFTVTQSGSSTCTYTISPTTNSLGAAGGTGSVNVAAPSGCVWPATSGTAWLTITSGSSGSGNGTVGYAVTANTSTSSRTGTLTIGGKTFTVTQAGQSCIYSISPTNNSFSAGAGTGTVNVTSASGCTWTATSNNTGWLNVTSGSSGSGNGTVNYSVTANTTTAQRNGTISIAGQTFTVSQSGNTCTYTISPTSKSFTSASGTGSVSVTTSSGCSWSATSTASSWLTITSGASGSGSGQLNYAVSANTGTAARTGSLTIANQTFTVTQAAQACTYSISPTSNSLSAGAGTGTVNVTSASGCTWTATSNNTGWLTVTSGGSGSGNGTVGYAVTANTTTTSRNGALSIAGQTFTVTQAGTAPVCSVNLSAGGFNVLCAGRQLQFTVYAASTCSWSASTNAPWITFISGAGKGNGTITFLVSTNTGAARTGTITIGTSTVTINQAGPPGILSAAPTSLAFGTMKSGSTSIKPVTVSNVGQANLKITSISIDTLSGSVTSFSQSNTCGTVSPGGSCTISVKFAPGGQGTKSTYLYVYSDGGITQLAVTGTAQ